METKNESEMPYYKQINNVKYDRKLLSIALRMMSEDRLLQINEDDMQKLWHEAEDGGRVTECEKQTLEYICNNYESSASAKSYLTDKLKTVQTK